MCVVCVCRSGKDARGARRVEGVSVHVYVCVCACVCVRVCVCVSGWVGGCGCTYRYADSRVGRVEGVADRGAHNSFFLSTLGPSLVIVFVHIHMLTLSGLGGRCS